MALLAAVGLGYRQWDGARARRAVADGEAALAARDLGTAAARFERYTELRPGDPAGWFRAARTARRAGRFPEAKRLLAGAEQRGADPDAVALERDLMLVQQGVIGEADVRLRASVGPDHPDAVLVLEALARGYVGTERWADARQACEMWRALEPNHPWPWHWEGLISERMVQPERAAEFHARALELAPDDPLVRLSAGRVAVERRRAAEALPHFEWVLARTPDDPAALLGRAQSLIELGRAAEAVAPIERVLARTPGAPEPLALRGRAALELGDPVAAEGHLRAAAHLAPADGEVLALLVRALRARGNDPEADALAARHAALEKDLRRLTELMRQIGPKTTDAAPCHEAGVLALKLGRTQQGLNYLADALRRRGDHRPTHAALAAHFRSVGKFDLAEFHKNRTEGP